MPHAVSSNLYHMRDSVKTKFPKTISCVDQDRLLHFHVHDGSEYPAKNHLALGDGEIDIADRLRLAEINRARCVLETKTIEALKHSVQWLKDEKYI